MLRLLLVLSACATTTTTTTPLQWKYGEPWGGLCATGKHQSPVELVADTSGFPPRVQMEYWASRTRLHHDGNTLQVDYDPDSKLIVDSKHFGLTQLRFHHPGEHVIDGKSFPLELQLVHRADDGKLAVVSVLVVEGAANRWLKQILDNLPLPGETREPTARVNAADLVPPSKRFLVYHGSLTQPPCSEDVTWLVMRTPIEMSADQIAQLARLLGDNHRAPQPLHGRSVVEGEVR